MRIYNHDIRYSYPDIRRLPGAVLYASRALGITSPQDMVQFPAVLRSQWEWIHSHYNRVGLDHAERVIWNHHYDTIHDFPESTISFFIFGPEAHKIRPDEKQVAVVRETNSKNQFIELCRELSIPTPRTICFAKGNAPTSSEVESIGFPLYVKVDISFSGYGVFYCPDMNSTQKTLREIGDKAYQLQENIPAITFLNVQYRGSADGTCSHLATTEQVLDGFTHAGNRSQNRFCPRHLTDQLAKVLVRRGIRDVFAFDVPVWVHEGEIRYGLLECNPRYNGSSYPSAIAQKLGVSRWVGMNFITRHFDLSKMELGDLEYNKERKTGAVIVNWGTIVENKLSILIASQNDIEEKSIIRELKSVLE